MIAFIIIGINTDIIFTIQSFTIQAIPIQNTLERKKEDDYLASKSSSSGMTSTLEEAATWVGGTA